VKDSDFDILRTTVFLEEVITSSTGDLKDIVGSMFLIFSESDTDLGMQEIISYDSKANSLSLASSVPLTVPQYSPSKYRIITAKSEVISSALWFSGTLIFNINFILLEETTIQFLFCLQNGRVFSPGAKPLISIGGTPQIPPSEMDSDDKVLRVTSQGPSPNFDIKLVSSNSQILGGLNTISFILESSYDIPGCQISGNTSMCTTISILGLNSFVTNDQFLTLSGLSANWFVNSRANWTRTDGILSLLLTRRVPPGILIKFSVILRNSFLPIPIPSAPSIAISGPVTFIPDAMNSTVLPIVLNATFISTNVLSSSNVAGSLNKLSISFVTNTEIEPGSTLTVTGLTGSPTPDSKILLTGAQAHAFDNSGHWFQKNGTLVVVAARAIFQAQFSFSVRNPTIANYSCNATCPAPQTSSCSCSQDSKAIVGLEVTGAWAIRNFRLGNYSFVPSTPPSFVNAAVFGSSTVTGALNTITLSLSPNFEIQQVSTMIILGLQGFETPDAPCRLSTQRYQPCLDWRIGVKSPIAGIIATNRTKWEQQSGILSVSTQDSLISDSRPLVFSFALRNSLVFHGSLQIQIGLNGDSISFPPAPLAFCQSVPCLPTNLIPAFMFTDISSSSSLYGGVTTITVLQFVFPWIGLTRWMGNNKIFRFFFVPGHLSGQRCPRTRYKNCY
jgi:hypothetical protein